MKYLLSYNELKTSSNNITVNSYEELLSLLKKYNIPLEKWGTGGFKTPKHSSDCFSTYPPGLN